MSPLYPFHGAPEPKRERNWDERVAREGNRTDRKVVARDELVYWKCGFGRMRPPLSYSRRRWLLTGTAPQRETRLFPVSMDCEPCQHTAGTDSYQHSVVCWHWTRSQWFSVVVRARRRPQNITRPYRSEASIHGCDFDSLKILYIPK